MDRDIYGSGAFKLDTTLLPSHHEHKWQAAGVIYFDDPDDDKNKWRWWAVAQSCECGEVRARRLFDEGR